MAGDHADMPSLSSYDKGKRDFEGRRYNKDIDAAREGMEALVTPIRKARGYNPKMVLTMGNHEERIMWAIQRSPELEGLISFDDLEYEKFGWDVIPYKHWSKIDGIYYSHLFDNPDSLTGTSLSGTVENRLNKLGISHTQGHQQKRQYGSRHVLDRTIHCLVSGASYPHQEKYLGPQGNEHWRGIVWKTEVKNGDYSPLFVTTKYLLRRYK